MIIIDFNKNRISKDRFFITKDLFLILLGIIFLRFRYSFKHNLFVIKYFKM